MKLTATPSPGDHLYIFISHHEDFRLALHTYIASLQISLSLRPEPLQAEKPPYICALLIPASLAESRTLAELHAFAKGWDLATGCTDEYAPDDCLLTNPTRVLHAVFGDSYAVTIKGA